MKAEGSLQCKTTVASPLMESTTFRIHSIRFEKNFFLAYGARGLSSEIFVHQKAFYIGVKGVYPCMQRETSMVLRVYESINLSRHETEHQLCSHINLPII